MQWLRFILSYLMAEKHIEIAHGSSILKSNKLYVYESIDYNVKESSVTIYDLKDGPISQIINTTYRIYNVPKAYTPKLLNLPQGLPDERSDQIWLLGGQNINESYNQSIYNTMWAGQFTESSNIKFDSNFIKKPNFDSFPIGGYSQDIVNINNKPVMYIIGGFISSPDKKTNILTSKVFKYEFNSNSWSDLSESSNSILPPISDHQTVVVDNFLLVTNGLSPNITTKKYPQTAPYNSSTSILNYYNKAYKFDLLSESWSPVSIRTNLDENLYSNGHYMSHMHGASLKLYKGSLVAYTVLYNLKTNNHEPYLALLDYNNWEWHWTHVNTDTGIDNTLQLSFHQSIVINDQLLLIHGFSNQIAWKKIFVINIVQRKFSSLLNFSGSSGAGTGLPIYLIATIVLAVIVVLLCIGIAYFQFVYKKRIEERKNKKSMKEIWVTEFVDIDAHKSIINSNMLENINTLTSDPITKSGLSQNEIFDNDASDISGLECFKYNPDVIEAEDINDIKASSEKTHRLS
ncbi:hypothetical protein CONCODRAFT_11931 [Conidiobolus coronatus NRRL 28638]|uniref:Galactose oxidase n=1 Tax=Conidiobolus coronatus (strain ATCC 28846 / CBS 209.66 / NRRL 28638) TaxID=796925 RepID=A0A137NTZ2_CONC2|nr:hypothetical protein CONCODRAFT_11931 [Conidiobolus coronatus NRRL 28638]|eukprot:KXN66263.1 hypothetical protein CONCODRAFT_11931 [Conidiobolus coronatus NRRL 28638]